MIGPGTARPLATDEVSNQDVEALREEVERLKSLLDEHGIDWKKPVESRDQATTPQPATPTPAGSESSLSTREKLALFRRLFRGRNDVYPLRWQSSKGKSGCNAKARGLSIQAASYKRWKTGAVRPA